MDIYLPKSNDYIPRYKSNVRKSILKKRTTTKSRVAKSQNKIKQRVVKSHLKKSTPKTKRK